MSPKRSSFKPKARRIAEAHLASSARGARLLAAAGGDAEHAARIDRVLDDLVDNAVIPEPPPAASEVIRLPARPYDQELEPELVSRPVGWTAALVLGAIGWLVVLGLIYAVVLVVEAIR
jgi:hypothetical protein